MIDMIPDELFADYKWYAHSAPKTNCILSFIECIDRIKLSMVCKKMKMHYVNYYAYMHTEKQFLRKRYKTREEIIQIQMKRLKRPKI